MGTLTRALIVVLCLGGAAWAQPMAPAAQSPQPTLPAELRLERENLLLQARVNELETQLAALKSQIIGERIGKAAPALIERLQAAAPGFDVDPATLEFKPKPLVAAAAPATPPATAAPQPRPQ